MATSRYSRSAHRHIPFFPYQLFLLYVEPVSTVAGAVAAHFFPTLYLNLTDPFNTYKSVSSVPLSTRIALSQLANLYLLFTLNEALVLRVTSDVRVWRTILFGLLVADFGHIFSVYPRGMSIYWSVWSWNAIDWGNLGFVYLGATIRICFLLGVGMSESRIGKNL
jgi:hypothetical protein